MKKQTCHNIRQLTYDKTHAAKKDNSQTGFEKNMPQNKTTHIWKTHMPHYKTTHIWKTKNTWHNIRQLTYEKKHATISDNSHMTNHMPKNQTTHIWKPHMPHYKTTHIWKNTCHTIKDNSHMRKKPWHTIGQLTYEKKTCHKIRRLS